MGSSKRDEGCTRVDRGSGPGVALRGVWRAVIGGSTGCPLQQLPWPQTSALIERKWHIRLQALHGFLVSSVPQSLTTAAWVQVDVKGYWALNHALFLTRTIIIHAPTPSVLVSQRSPWLQIVHTMTRHSSFAHKTHKHKHIANKVKLSNYIRLSVGDRHQFPDLRRRLAGGASNASIASARRLCPSQMGFLYVPVSISP